MAKNKTTAKTLAVHFVESLDGLKYVFVSGGGWYQYDSKTGWEQVPEWTVRAEINKKCWEILPKSEDLTVQKSGDVLQLVKTVLTVPNIKADSLDPALWIRFDNGEIVAESAAGWIPCNNALIDVDAAAVALYNKTPIPEEAIKPLSPELFVLGRVPCDFEPDSECPRWLQFVNEVIPNISDRKNLQRIFGLSLTYDRRFNVFFVFHGVAGTGKSTCLYVLEKLNSGAVCSVALLDFGDSFTAAPLTEYRINIVQDMASVDVVLSQIDKVNKREYILKNLTEGGFIEVERKYQDRIRRRLVALSIFGSNQVPRFLDKGGGVRRRLRLLQFPVQFNGKPGEVLNLKEELLTELPGVFIWSLTGYGELLSKGYKTFPESEEAEALKHEAELASSPVLQFCEDYLEADPCAVVLSSAVYNVYKSFCVENGLQPMAANSFVSEVCSAMEIKKPVLYGKKRLKAFLGIRLVMDSEETSDSDSYSAYK